MVGIAEGSGWLVCERQALANDTAARLQVEFVIPGDCCYAGYQSAAQLPTLLTEAALAHYLHADLSLQRQLPDLI